MTQKCVVQKYPYAFRTSLASKWCLCRLTLTGLPRPQVPLPGVPGLDVAVPATAAEGGQGWRDQHRAEAGIVEAEYNINDYLSNEGAPCNGEYCP